MKTEERKELKTNSLSRFFERMANKFKGGPSRTALYIWGIVLAIVVAFVGYKIYSRWSFNKNSKRWIQLYQANNREDLEGYLKENNKNVQGHVVRFHDANSDLDSSLPRLREYKDSTKKLDEAAEQYEKLAEEFPDKSILPQLCLMGEIVSHLARGEMDKAQSVQAKLEKKYPKSKITEEMARRIKRAEENSSLYDAVHKELSSSK